MSKANWIEQLERVLARPVHQLQIPIQDWNEAALEVEEGSFQPNKNAFTLGECLPLRDGRLWFALSADGRNLDVLEIDRSGLTTTEINLVSFTLTQIAGTAEPAMYAGLTDAERTVRELGGWIDQQLTTGEHTSVIPERLIRRNRMYTTMIPFLLISDQAEASRTGYSELEKLLRTFLSEDILLIPLKEQEWLILGPVSLIREAQTEEREEEEEESEEESLASIASGLHDMLASEWIGDCHLAVLQPIQPTKDLVAAAGQLRETIQLGRAFHVGSNIHLPWLLQLEWLLSTIPEPQRLKFMEQALKRTDVFLEPEILTTLETFFSLDCNVSETAKKLYIHRNTLLYRLDKLKQETELDVRQFGDAVLVKIVLLLYKVTKRK